MRELAISDIHGCRQTFEAILDKIALSTSDQLYLLGDYVDRGPDSRGVLDLIFSLQRQGYNLHCLAGNHEAMMLRAMEDRTYRSEWLSRGGAATMRSFDAIEPEDIPGHYLAFLRQLSFYHITHNSLLVHAGINFRHANPLEDKYSLLHIRYWYEQIDRNWLGENRIIVHGHTPVSPNAIQRQVLQLDRCPAIGIDSGCSFQERSPNTFGYLCAFDLKDRVLYFQQNVEK